MIQELRFYKGLIDGFYALAFILFRDHQIADQVGSARTAKDYVDLVVGYGFEKRG